MVKFFKTLCVVYTGYALIKLLECEMSEQIWVPGEQRSVCQRQGVRHLFQSVGQAGAGTVP